MEITATRADSANAKIAAVATNDMIAQRLDKVAKNAAKSMKVDGFRKGKVPVALVKQRYGEQLQQDAEREVVQEIMDEGLKKLEIDKDSLIGEPNITRFDKKENEIDIEVAVSTKPEINLDNFKECVPDFEEEEARAEEVEDRLKMLAMNAAPSKKIEEDRPLAENDFALMDFEGFVNGEPIERGKEENYLLQIGSNTFIPGFEEKLVGMKAGEEKTIELNFPEEYHDAKLKGQLAKFNVKLHEIQVKEAAEIDDELAKKMLPKESEATADMLKERVGEQIKHEKMLRLFNEKLKPEILESFAEKIDCDIPESVVEQELNMTFRSAIGAMSPEEVKELTEDTEKAKEVRESYREDAEKSVKITFIIDALSKQENVTVSEQEVVQALYYEAMQQGLNPQETLEMYKAQGLLPAYRLAMIEDKLLHQILDRKLKGEL